MSDAEAPLFAGLKVIDAGSWIAGPVAATLLADYGADVIKVEQPGVGDGYRALAQSPGMPKSAVNYTWDMDARNKRSIALNLKSAAGKDLLMRLLATTDVYVTNQPLSMRRALGLTYDDLRTPFPRLIYASLTAYGEAGPERDREGFDLVAYWSRTGMMDLVRADGALPSQSLPGMGDHPTAVSLYAAIVTALLRRERTGRGGHVHTSLLANGLWAASCVAQAKFTGADFSEYRNPTRGGATRFPYRARDGRFLQFSMVRTPAEIEALLDVVDLAHLKGDERFATPASRFEHGHALAELLGAALAKRTSDDWLRRMHAAGVPASRIETLDDVLQDPQIRANGMLTAGADGAPLINHPVNVADTTRMTPSAAPALGQHTDAVLAELGVDAQARAALRAAGVIGAL